MHFNQEKKRGMRSSPSIKAASTLAPWVGETFVILQSVYSLWIYQSFVCNILESIDEILPNVFQGSTPPVFSHFLK